jgi:hypothetical protein
VFLDAYLYSDSIYLCLVLYMVWVVSMMALFLEVLFIFTSR